MREKAVYYVPADNLTTELNAGLQGMVRTEAEQLARVHAVDKLLECYGATKESVGKSEYSDFYKDLHSDDPKTKEAVFRKLDALFN